MTRIRRVNRGAVSIFIVMLTMLLMAIISVSFVRLVLREQRQAVDNNLSQSAYDSALAGVEDGKRALIAYDNLPTGSTKPDLSTCNAINGLLGVTNTDEVGIAADSDQAYTCVKVSPDTNDYLGSIMRDEVGIVPLKSSSAFTRILIEWFSSEDLTAINPLSLTGGPNMDLLPVDMWPLGRPPVLEVQLMQTGQSFRLSQFDGNNSHTLFLYPKNMATEPATSFQDDVRFTAGSNPVLARCTASVISKYACRATISVPNPVGGSASDRQNALLRVVPRYNRAHYRVAMLDNSNNIVKFKGVQPMIDSTGRSNNLFRRVNARVEIDNSAVMPDSAVDLTGNFCKTMVVTDSRDDYNRGACEP